MSALRKIKRVGKKATKFHYSATYQSVLIECHSDKWTPHMIQIAWHRRGRRIVSQILPWLPSPDTPTRGLVVWPEPEVVEASITLYKGPKDSSYEHKNWDFSVIDVDRDGQRKVLATSSIDMVRYASALPFEHELQLKLKPVSRKIKKILLELSLSSVFLKEGKATDDDMISLASMMSVSNLSMIGNLEDEDDDYAIRRFGNGRSISPDVINAAVPSTDKLIDWAQQVTTGYSGVKIINMTTSWRNGLAFCAIIHYYRPDLLEFKQLSKQSIKENNRLAFDIAQELGIACPLTPDMMLLRDIPDKLAVTAFVYQMFNYFTMAVTSAIVKPTCGATKDCSKPSPASPFSGGFDFSEIEKLTCKNLSPIVKDDPASKRNLSGNKWSKHSLKEEQEAREQEMERNHRDEKGVVGDLEHNHGNKEGVVNTPEGSRKSEEGVVQTPDKQDEPISHSTPITTTNGQASNNDITSDPSPVYRGESPSPPLMNPNTRGVSLTTPISQVQPLSSRSELSLPLSSKSESSSSTGSKPCTPDKTSDTQLNSEDDSQLNDHSLASPVDEGEQKKEYYRKQVKEMMANVGIKRDITTFNAISSKTRKMIQARRNSEGNTLRTTASSPSLPSRGPSLLEIKKCSDDVFQSSTISETQVVVDSNKQIEGEREKRSGHHGLTRSVESSPNLGNKKDKHLNGLKTSSTNSSPRKPATTDLKNSRNRSSSLVILPPAPKRSAAAQLMAKEPIKVHIEETDKPVQGEEHSDSAHSRPNQIPGLSGTDSLTSSNESPSAWISHNHDLADAILVSTSDYVKNELLLIQRDLRPLEERAATVENEIRDAMGEGDSNKEELLTVEYFKLLNEKNVLIKKQIELNLLEKEEDLEKRQFFINRELRPLAAIPEDQKTEQQKLREQQLIKELLEVMNEREKLDDRLTKTTGYSSNSVTDLSEISSNDASKLSQTASTSFSSSLKSRFTKDRSVSSQRGEKDCVIS